MPAAIAYWVLMFIWLLFGGWSSRNTDGTWDRMSLGGIGLQFVLFVLIGWKLFGAPIQ